MQELMSDFGLAVSTLGALIVLLPGMPQVGSTLTGWGEVKELENAREDFPVDAEDVRTYGPDKVSWFPSVARIAMENTGIEPDKIVWTPARNQPINMDLALQSSKLEASYSVAEPTLIHDWIASELDRIHQRRKGYMLTLGAFLIGVGFLIQLFA